MKIDTLYFGTVECQENEIVHFPEGLFGFESQKDFLPVPFEDGTDALVGLQSVTEKYLCFIIMNPFLMDEEYDPQLKAEDYEALGTTDEGILSYYVICGMRPNMEESTVNMRCPIVVNSATRNAIQVILDTDRYKFRHLLSEYSKAGR